MLKQIIKILITLHKEPEYPIEAGPIRNDLDPIDAS